MTYCALRIDGIWWMETDFELVYGHVLAQKLPSSLSQPPNDVSEASQVLL